MEQYDYLNLKKPEDRQFLLDVANDQAKALQIASEDIRRLKRSCSIQENYITILEKQVELLQKTLAVCNKQQSIKKRCKKHG